MLNDKSLSNSGRTVGAFSIVKQPKKSEVLS